MEPGWVITGASGFIGKALFQLGKQKKIHVTGLSRSAGDPFVPVQDYADYPGSSSEVLIHLAQPRAAALPAEGNEVALCSALVSKPWKHVVYISSAVVYGDAVTHARKPAEEVAAFNAYTSVKLSCEALVLAAGGTCIRLGNIYGPGMAINNVIGDILRQIPGTGPVHVRDTTPVRDFLWIDDAASCIAAAAEKMPGGILNAGSGEGVSIAAIASELLTIGGQADRPVVADHASGRTSHLVLDISATTEKLQWQPVTTLSAGLSRLFKIKTTNE
jgi:nucleoside-diphosphate-sugar epimerase